MGRQAGLHNIYPMLSRQQITPILIVAYIAFILIQSEHDKNDPPPWWEELERPHLSLVGGTIKMIVSLQHYISYIQHFAYSAMLPDHVLTGLKTGSSYLGVARWWVLPLLQS